MKYRLNNLTSKIVSSVLLAVGALAISSCSSDTEYLDDNDTEVRFYLGNAPYGGIGTKSQAIDSVEEARDGDMIVSMRSYPREPKTIAEATKTTWSTTNLDAKWAVGDKLGMYMRLASGTADPTVDRSNVLYTTTAATPADTSPLTTSVAPPLYFPRPATVNVTFYSYYPYSNGTNSAISPVQFPTAASQQSLSLNYTLPLDQSSRTTLFNADLMSCTPVTSNRNSPNIALSFTHKMTLMTFAIKSGNTLNGKTMTKVELSGNKITKAGILNLATSTITRDLNSTATFYATMNQAINKTAIYYVEFLVNPFALNSLNNGNGELLLTITANNGGIYKTGLNVTTNKTFNAGTRYVYNITVGN